MNNNYEISNYILKKKKQKVSRFFWGFSFLERIVADPFNLMIKVSVFKNIIKNFVANKKNDFLHVNF